MVKTTVYLPAELKLRLERMSEDSNLSEAELIRRALEELTGTHRPRPRLGLFPSGAEVDDWDEAMKGFGEA